MPTKRIGSLDGLRGIAALIVVVYHALLIDPSFWDGTVHGPFQWALNYTPLKIVWAGQEAVWVFFVLSGFVLVRPYLADRPLHTGRYFARRTIRLYLPFFGSFVLAEVLRHLLTKPQHFASGWTAFNLLPSTTWDAVRTLFLFAGDFTTLNSVWWTLRWEVWFSLLLPVVVIVVRRFRRHGVTALVLSFASIILSNLIADQVHVIGRSKDNPFSMLPIFGVGVALAMLEPQVRRLLEHRGRVTVMVLTLIGVVALTAMPIAFTVLLHAGHPPITLWSYLALPVTVAGAGLLVALALAAPGLTGLLEHRTIEWLGIRSYTLYLVHEPLLVAFVVAADASKFAWWTIPGGIALSLVATAVLYPIVERPALQLVRRISPGPTGAKSTDAIVMPS